jgi:hypothetical protein
VNAAKLRPALPSSVVDRQSKQIYVAPHQFYNYYQYQMLLPTAAGETDSKSTPGIKKHTTASSRPLLLLKQSFMMSVYRYQIKGDSELGALEGRQNLPLTATPAKTGTNQEVFKNLVLFNLICVRIIPIKFDSFSCAECLIADSAKNGFNGCTKASHSASGTIDLTFSEAKQGVVIALVPNPRYYSKLKITCSEMSDKVMAFTVSLSSLFV